MVSQGMSQIPGLSGGFGLDPQGPPRELNLTNDMVAELVAEKESLDPAYVHCARLLEAGT